MWPVVTGRPRAPFPLKQKAFGQASAFPTGRATPEGGLVFDLVWVKSVTQVALLRPGASQAQFPYCPFPRIWFVSVLFVCRLSSPSYSGYPELLNSIKLLKLKKVLADDGSKKWLFSQGVCFSFF